ncbi:MAG: NAD-dependent epimerase/dehydratase family protein [Verrucomicrobia bacterium]|nr:NAD-dependent epimerase/dehydratase family protein [Verrucomicrobiota bacterium]
MRKRKHYLVTGGAGFVGSNLVERLMKRGGRVTVYDNLSLGRREHLAPFLGHPKFRFIQADLLDFTRVKRSMAGVDCVWHLAANSDIGYGERYTDWDLKQGTLVTYNVLEAMRVRGVRELVFASSSAIFGDTGTTRIREDHGPLAPISFYGASKLACEGLITAFCHNYDMQAWIYRFANIVGDNATHGVIHDFITRLKKDPAELRILGDGKQRKPYLYVKECVDGMLYGFDHADERVNVFNLGCPGATSVDRIAAIVTSEMGLRHVKRCYTGGARGWKSDVPQVRFDVSKLTRLGWKASYSSDQACRVAARAIIASLEEKPPVRRLRPKHKAKRSLRQP